MNAISYDEGRHIVIVKFVGKYSTREIRKGIKEAAACVKQYDCYRVLVDRTSADSPDINTVDVMEMSNIFAETFTTYGIESASVQRALLVKERHEISDLLENLAVNRGLWFKVFEDRKLALDWLKA